MVDHPGHHAALEVAEALQRPDHPGDDEQRPHDGQQYPPHGTAPLLGDDRIIDRKLPVKAGRSQAATFPAGQPKHLRYTTRAWIVRQSTGERVSITAGRTMTGGAPEPGQDTIRESERFHGRPT